MTKNANGKFRALLVDDKAFARSVGMRILKTAGLTAIQEASNGQEALDLLRQKDQSIDIVFCDLMMPDMDGVEFVRHVSTLPIKPAFVFVSGAGASLLNTVENTARARGLRVLGTIEKPLTVAATVDLLARFEGAVPMAYGGDRVVPDITPMDLSIALEADQFLMHFQPKVALADGALDGFEALARWQHPDRGMIPPIEFVAAAEKHGLIGALTERTVRLALRQCAEWAKAGLVTKVCVNLSAYMLVNTDFPDRLAKEATQFGIEPRQIVLEITESGLFQDTANALDILARLHMKGFPLSIDDFGTGYSSMEQLSQVPFSEMKVDRAFVRGAAKNVKAKAILEASVELARRLGLSIVAEGVETQEDWDMLHNVGVDLVQGYFISKPMAAENVQPWIAAWGEIGRQ
ncbi:EAL domain-containing response regulator [Oceanibacterium hippocampi]|uniref:Cyclic di-GMP phosphodiesterase Gmr n=1 Tax=Oceanibacterium hippocampi TaxID=745714 RepID=A0A1Y5U1D7_9PROT|nr:EAL domain-containing response regulator [Oceanibacterium hippocampi]SLN73951.1 Cyclic di-GMP phosphodiesterase Gmr [Oceanibacterium hippocampi]